MLTYQKCLIKEKSGNNDGDTARTKLFNLLETLIIYVISK